MMNEKSKRIIDAVFDIFYSNATSETKVHKLGVYLEHFLRMRFKINGKFCLGDPIIRNECQSLYFDKEIFANIEKIRNKRNHASHTEKDTPITELDLQEKMDCLEKIFVLFFCEYFQKYPFGSNLKVADSLSLLPPQSRLEILTILHQDKEINSDKIVLLDKLCLATLKAKGLDCARQWIEENKKELQSTKICLEIDENLASAIGQERQTMYDVCLEKVMLVNQAREEQSVPTYTNFEEAKEYYINFNLRERIGDSSEAQEFSELMDFIFIGR